MLQDLLDQVEVPAHPTGAPGSSNGAANVPSGADLPTVFPVDKLQAALYPDQEASPAAATSAPTSALVSHVCAASALHNVRVLSYWPASQLQALLPAACCSDSILISSGLALYLLQHSNGVAVWFDLPPDLTPSPDQGAACTFVLKLNSVLELNRKLGLQEAGKEATSMAASLSNGGSDTNIQPDTAEALNEAYQAADEAKESGQSGGSETTGAEGEEAKASPDTAEALRWAPDQLEQTNSITASCEHWQLASSL